MGKKHDKEALIADFYKSRTPEEIHRIIFNDVNSGIEKRLKKHGLSYATMESNAGHTKLTYQGNGIKAEVEVTLNLEITREG